MSDQEQQTEAAGGPSAVERRVGPWPAAVGRASSDGWQIDPELLVRIKRDISTNEETRYGLDMEQIETVMLALVRMGLAPNEQS